MPLDGDPRPYSKETQLARQTKRYHRKKATKGQWATIAAEKQGPCRVTGAAPPNQLAHLISRAQGGPDEAWNIVPLSLEAHARFDGGDPETCRLVAESLTDEEYSRLIEFAGESVFETRFKIRYSRP